jgi:hypothetical protein
MTNAIKTGSILVETGALMPDSVVLQSEPCANGWSMVTNFDLSQLDTAIHKARWTFFFMAGELAITSFGFDSDRAVNRAMKRVVTNAASHKCNCAEITSVSRKSFLGMPYVNVTAHSRHIQPSSTFDCRQVQ